MQCGRPCKPRIIVENEFEADGLEYQGHGRDVSFKGVLREREEPFRTDTVPGETETEGENDRGRKDPVITRNTCIRAQSKRSTREIYGDDEGGDIEADQRKGILSRAYQTVGGGAGSELLRLTDGTPRRLKAVRDGARRGAKHP